MRSKKAVLHFTSENYTNATTVATTRRHTSCIYNLCARVPPFICIFVFFRGRGRERQGEKKKDSVWLYVRVPTPGANESCTAPRKLKRSTFFTFCVCTSPPLSFSRKLTLYIGHVSTYASKERGRRSRGNAFRSPNPLIFSPSSPSSRVRPDAAGKRSLSHSPSKTSHANP